MTEFEKLTRKIRRAAWQVNEKFSLMSRSDRVMACVSGGKDSYTMLDVLRNMQKVVGFDLVAVNLDQRQPGFPETVLPQYMSDNGIPFKVYQRDTYSIVMKYTPAGKTLCSMCSRLRRGNLYAIAEELGATKIALGHHADDILETFFLNLFFSGKLEAMPPKLISDDGRHVIIRPLAGVRQHDIATYASYRNFPIIPCNLCGSQADLQRNHVRKMIADWDAVFPDRSEIMLNALTNVSPSHLLDTSLYDFSDPRSNGGDEKIMSRGAADVDVFHQ